jgi:hypothetical protein
LATFFRATGLDAFRATFFREGFFFTTIRFDLNGFKTTAGLYIWRDEFKGVISIFGP